MIYLATPYSDPDPAVREERFNVVNRVAARMMMEGLHVYSPISHSHSIAKAGWLPTDWSFWELYDTKMIIMCGQMIVLRQAGWAISTGVQHEIRIAAGLGHPIEYMDP